MRVTTTLPLLALLVAGASACTVNNQPQRSPQNPGAWGPQPQGYYGQPQGYPQPQGPQGPALWPPPIFRPVNVPALMALQGRVPCAPREVAPGTWATFDCAPYQAITRAIQYFPLPRFNFLPIGAAPAGVDHRTEGSEGPIKDQGAVGVCTAVSLSTAMDNAVRRMGRQDTIAALHIWSKYGVPTMGAAGDSNVDKSITVEQVWQYDPVKACKLMRSPMDTCTTAYGVSSGSESFDPALKSEHANADASGRYRLAALEQLHSKPADVNEMASVLAGGDDIWISFSVNDQAWMSRSMNNAVIPDYEAVDDTGHAVVLAGYRTLPNGTKQFLIHNSWGTRWGESGYGWISEAMVTRYTRSAYKVRVTEGAGGGGQSQPAGPGAAPGGGCPAGQTKDPIFGACIPGGGLPGFPGALPGGLPGGFPLPGAQPAPGQPPAAPGQPQPKGPQPQQSGCPQGQIADMMTGKCWNACPGGGAPVGGMCLPVAPPR
jgi:hypothetical protein